MDVENKAAEIALVFDVFRLVSALPQASRPSESAIKPSVEAVLDSVHSSPQRHRRRTDHQMEMVRHYRPRENRPAVPLLDIVNDLNFLKPGTDTIADATEMYECVNLEHIPPPNQLGKQDLGTQCHNPRARHLYVPGTFTSGDSRLITFYPLEPGQTKSIDPHFFLASPVGPLR